MVGLLATSRRSPCLLTFYALCLILAFLVLCAGVVASVRIIFTIAVGIDHSLALPLLKQYGKDKIATHTWDNLQGIQYNNSHIIRVPVTCSRILLSFLRIEHYRCCGAETTFDLGYMVWEQNPGLSVNDAVPDSCCLEPEKDCGFGIFENHSLKRMSEYVKKIHVHGCLRAMEYVLQVYLYTS